MDRCKNKPMFCQFIHNHQLLCDINYNTLSQNVQKEILVDVDFFIQML